MVICKNCKKEKPHAGLGLCRKCYDEDYNKHHRKYFADIYVSNDPDSLTTDFIENLIKHKPEE